VERRRIRDAVTELDDLIESLDRHMVDSSAWKICRELAAAHAALLESRDGGGTAAVHNARRRLDAIVVLAIDLRDAVLTVEDGDDG
jgi:hypothetical protein